FGGLFWHLSGHRPARHGQGGHRAHEPAHHPFGAMLCTAVAASMIACNQTLSILLTHQLCTDVPGGAPSPDLKTAPNVVQ
ncbi:MAG: hypothetical protein ACLR1P_07355, partial [Oscillospiraceae bacterium]